MFKLIDTAVLNVLSRFRDDVHQVRINKTQSLEESLKRSSYLHHPTIKPATGLGHKDLSKQRYITAISIKTSCWHQWDERAISRNKSSHIKRQYVIIVCLKINGTENFRCITQGLLRMRLFTCIFMTWWQRQQRINAFSLAEETSSYFGICIAKPKPIHLDSFKSNPPPCMYIKRLHCIALHCLN